MEEVEYYEPEVAATLYMLACYCCLNEDPNGLTPTTMTFLKDMVMILVLYIDQA